MSLLGYWHDTLAGIDEDYTFGDLVSLLREVDDIERLSSLLQCDVAVFLTEADAPRQADNEPPMRSVEVRNIAVLSEYEADPNRPDRPISWLDSEEAAEQDRLDAGIATLTGERPPIKLIDATGDDPITGEPQLRRLRVSKPNGRWKPPYQLTHEFEGRGGRRWSTSHDPDTAPQPDDEVFALDFTPVSSLLHVPLRYDPSVQFWSGPVSGAGEVVFETELTITLGEFLHAIFWTLGFHGSPAQRDEVLAMIRERARAIDRLRHGEGE